jgi:hypothetical protein
MQAAVVSILLMVGACGAPADSVAPDPMNGRVTVRQAGHFEAADGPYSNPDGASLMHFDGHYVDGHQHPRVVFPWYSPVWLMHGNAEFYPGSYARPYDFREKFDYPWNGPRPGGYVQFGLGPGGPRQFGRPQNGPRQFEDLPPGTPHLESVPPGDQTSTTNGPVLRSARSPGAAPAPLVR